MLVKGGTGIPDPSKDIRDGSLWDTSVWLFAFHPTVSISFLVLQVQHDTEWYDLGFHETRIDSKQCMA